MKFSLNLFLMIWVVAGLAGCESAPTKFYTLNSTAKAGVPVPGCNIVIESVFVPASIDRPQFMTVTSPNRVEFDEFNRWAAPLSESIAGIVSTDLGTLLGTSRVAGAPMPGFGPAYRVTIRIERFEFERGSGKTNGDALIEALWSVRDPEDRDAGSGQTIAREPVQSMDDDVLVTSYSHALAKVSTDIAAVIRKNSQK
jgi:uncharacterized lipoprotein YmbA